MNSIGFIIMWAIVALIGLLGFLRSRRRMDDIFEEIRGQSLGTFTYHPVRHLGGDRWEYAPGPDGRAMGLPNLKMTTKEAAAEDRAAGRNR